jgi:hypothetical protein
VTGNPETEARLRVADAQRRMATRDMLLGLHRQRKVEFIESLGAEVALISMGARDRDRIEKLSGYGTDEFDRTKHVMMSLITCIEEPKLTEDDIEALAEQDIRIIDELIMHITLLNIVGGDPETAKKLLKKTSNSDSDSSSPND